MSRSLRPVAAAVLGWAVALSAPAAARDLVISDGPVTAGGFDCKGCVKRKALDENAVSIRKIKNNSVTEDKIDDGAVGTSEIRDAAVTVEKLGQDVLDMTASSGADFYITLDTDGAEETIATNGPLTYFARCLVNVEEPPGSMNFEDRVEIVATSSVSGWFESGESDSNGTDNPPFSAGEQEVVFEQDGVPNGRIYDDVVDDSSIVAPGGFYLAIEGDTSGAGLNILNHDCLVTGNLLRITGTP